MRIKRALNILAATLFATTVATTAYSPAASAASSVYCDTGSNYSLYWLDCHSSNGTQTIWYINGVRTSEGQGASYHSFFCTYGRKYTIGVNLGTSLAASWTGYCVL
jgi:hypothetical protein